MFCYEANFNLLKREDGNGMTSPKKVKELRGVAYGQEGQTVSKLRQTGFCEVGEKLFISQHLA